MRLSLVFTGFGPLAETLPVVTAAEQSGFDGVWSSEYLGFHDGVVPSAMYLGQNQRIDVGIMGLSTAGRHPGLMAMELMSLSELAPGRIRCQVGVGDAGATAKLGQKISKPVAATEAFVRCLRETMQGQNMRETHPQFTFEDYQLAGMGPAPLIDVMAIRPKMIQLACRLGDGISLSIGASTQYLREVMADIERELAAAGRSRADFRVTALAMTSIGEDLDKACEMPAMINAGAHQATAAYLARGVVCAEELAQIESEQGAAGVMGFWTPDKIRETAFIASADGITERLAQYADLGIDELGLMMVNPMEEQAQLVEKFAQARRDIQA